MKKIVFYALCIQVIVIAGCSGDDKSKDKTADSTKTNTNTDTASVKKVTGTGITPPASDAAATMANKSKYAELMHTTEKVKFNYKEFTDFINQMDVGYSSKADDIYLTYGAYNDEDTKRYLASHPTPSATPINYDEIIKQPCLLESYKVPQTDEFKHLDIGSLCPPPYSCSSEFKLMKTSKKKTLTEPDPDEQAKTTISYYNEIYDPNSTLRLTEKVKFNIKDIIRVVDSLDKKYNGSKISTNIYFALGAYTIADANLYIKLHPKYSVNDIKNKTCLLFAYYNPDPKIPKEEDHYIYLDFGVLCPPDK